MRQNKPQTINQIAQEVYKIVGQEAVKSFAKIIYIAGGIDGKQNSASNFNDKSAQEILDTRLSLEQLDANFQENIFKKYRGQGVERQNISSGSFGGEDRSAIIECFKQVGFIDKVEPSRKNYDEVLVLGATMIGVKSRIDDLKVLDLEYKKVSFLTGERALWMDSPSDNFEDDKIAQNLLVQRCDNDEVTCASIDEKMQEIKNLHKQEKGSDISVGDLRKAVEEFYTKQYLEPKRQKFPTEADGIEYMFKKDQFFASRNVRCIYAKKSPEKPRVDTLDTVNEWFKEFEEVAKSDVSPSYNCIVISDQPHLKAQSQAFALISDTKNIEIEVVAKGYENPKAELLLTEMAGTLNRKKIMLERFAQQDSKSSSLPSSAPSSGSASGSLRKEPLIQNSL